MRVTFNELAESELNNAAQYYELKRSGLGAAFIAEVQRCTAEIVNHPRAAPVTLGTIRRRLCHRFPYGLLYSENDQEVRILAVMHLHRRRGDREPPRLKRQRWADKRTNYERSRSRQ